MLRTDLCHYKMWTGTFNVSFLCLRRFSHHVFYWYSHHNILTYEAETAGAARYQCFPLSEVAMKSKRSQRFVNNILASTLMYECRPRRVEPLQDLESTWQNCLPLRTPFEQLWYGEVLWNLVGFLLSGLCSISVLLLLFSLLRIHT